MNILINLISIKKGGGQQVASNFIEQIKDKKDFKVTFLVTKDSYIHGRIKDLKIGQVYAVNNTLISRFLLQKFTISKLIRSAKIELIYTLFGPGIQYKGIKSVTGCAYSNLFFPEIDFWKEYSFIKRCYLKLIDKYRLKHTLNSDALIFENHAMAERATQLFDYPPSKVTFILPSVSEYPIVNSDDDINTRFKEIDVNDFNILMLTGWHKNKNIEIVPEILKKLGEKYLFKVRFVITVSPKHPDSIKLMNNAKQLGVEDNILLFGPVAPHEVPKMFARIHAVMLLSLLESFSNNIIEAWYFNKPLFISNEEWSRAICKDAAIYVERNNSSLIADAIIKYINNQELREELRHSSSLILKNYPNPKEKVELQINFLRKIFYA